MTEARQIVIVSAGTNEPSSTRMLADRIATHAATAAGAHGHEATVGVVELRTLASDLANATVTGFLSEKLRAAMDRVAQADGLVAATPVYKASYSGLFKSFFDVIDDDALIGMPVVLAATAGTPRHALVPDEAMRPLFAYLRALPLPTSVFAATEDWGDSGALASRVDRAAAELVASLETGMRESLLGTSRSLYKRTFDGSASDAERGADDIDFDSDMMRLATGGSAEA